MEDELPLVAGVEDVPLVPVAGVLVVLPAVPVCVAVPCVVPVAAGALPVVEVVDELSVVPPEEDVAAFFPHPAVPTAVRAKRARMATQRVVGPFMGRTPLYRP